LGGAGGSGFGRYLTQWPSLVTRFLGALAFLMSGLSVLWLGLSERLGGSVVGRLSLELLRVGVEGQTMRASVAVLLRGRVLRRIGVLWESPSSLSLSSDVALEVAVFFADSFDPEVLLDLSSTAEARPPSELPVVIESPSTTPAPVLFQDRTFSSMDLGSFGVGASLGVFGLASLSRLGGLAGGAIPGKECSVEC
jgi:hypothetical protein